MKDRKLDAFLVEKREPSLVNKEIPLNRSQRACILVITNDYLVYLYEHEFDVD